MDLKKIGDLLQDVDLKKRRRYIRKEFQAYGLLLADELNDWKNRSLYIRLAKQYPRHILEEARYFIKDQAPGKIKSKVGLFMWKLSQLKAGIKNDKQSRKRRPKRSKSD